MTVVVGIAALVVVWFGLLWCGICYALARVARWPELRRLYASNPVDGRRIRFSGYLRTARYRGALLGASTAAGLYLDVAAPFRLGAGPVLIPWREISASAPSGGRLSTVTLDFARAGTSLRVAEGVAEVLLAERRSIG